MPETDADDCSAVCVWMRLRLFLCITRNYYVRSVLIIVATLLICTSWAEIFREVNVVSCYAFTLILCLVITFFEKGLCDGKRATARNASFKRNRDEWKRLRRNEERAVQQALQEGQRASTQERRAFLLARQEEQMAAYQARREGEQPPAVAAPVDIHRPNVPSDISNPGENEPPNVPLQLVEHSDPTRNVSQPIAGPSTQFPPNRPMDVINEEPQIVVPPERTESSVSSSNLPQSSSDLSTQSTRSLSLNLTSEGTRNDNLPQSSIDQSSLSTSSASASEEPRFDESQQAMPSDSGHNVSQQSTDSSSQSNRSESSDDVANEETQND